MALRLYEKLGRKDGAFELLELLMDLGMLERKGHVKRVIELAGEDAGKMVEALYASGRMQMLDDASRLVMIDALGEAQLLKQAVRLVRDASSKRMPSLSKLYECTINAAVIAGDYGLAFELYEDMLERGWGKSASILVTMLQACRATNDTVRSVELANNMVRLCRDMPSIREGNQILAACVAAKEWDLGVMALVEMANKRRLIFDQDTYQLSITLLYEKREGQRAVQLFREMQSRGFQPDFCDYRRAIIASHERQADLSLELARELLMQKPSPRLEASLTRAILGACRITKDWRLAKQVFELARAQEVDRPLSLWNGLLAVLASAQKTDSLLASLEEMRFQGVTPDATTYTTAISALAKVGDYRQAIQWLSVMSWEGIPATTLTYNCVLDACAHGMNSAKAAEIFAEMKERKVPVDLFTYGSLVNAFARCGQWEPAVRVLEEMRSTSDSSGLRPNNFIYCSAMSACNRANQWQRALQIFDQLLADKSLTPDQYTYNEALNACARGGLADRALQVFDHAKASGVRTDLISYTRALSACVAAERWDDAQELLQRMTMDRVVPDRTCSHLIDAVIVHTQQPQQQEGGKRDTPTPAAG